MQLGFNHGTKSFWLLVGTPSTLRLEIASRRVDSSLTIEAITFYKITKDTQLPQIFGHMPFKKWKLQENDFSHIHRVLHTICPEWPAYHPQGGGWQATRPVSRVKWLWRHRQTRRNGNVVRLDSSNFPTFTSEKYLFGAYRRKIIKLYCPLVTEKSTNPRVKWTC